MKFLNFPNIQPGTAGSVLFLDGSLNVAQDNDVFYWNATDNRLGLGNNAPTDTLDVTGTAKISGNLSLIHNDFCDGRLTLTTALPYTFADVTGAATIYFTPAIGNNISLYDGSEFWTTYPFNQLSVALGTLSNATVYDVFAYMSGGTVTLKIGPAWASATTRGTGAGTTELVSQDGIWVNNNDIASGPNAFTGRYLGSFYTTATTTTEDSNAKRFLWNLYNQLYSLDFQSDSSKSWTNAGNGTWSAANSGDADWKHEFIVGLPSYISAESTISFTQPGQFSIAIDGTTPSNTRATTLVTTNVGVTTSTAHFIDTPGNGGTGIGYHYLQAVQTTYSVVTATFYGRADIATNGIITNSCFITKGWR